MTSIRDRKPNCFHPKIKKFGAVHIKLFVDLRKKGNFSTEHSSSSGLSCQDLFYLNHQNLFNFYIEFEMKTKKRGILTSQPHSGLIEISCGPNILPVILK